MIHWEYDGNDMRMNLVEILRKFYGNPMGGIWECNGNPTHSMVILWGHMGMQWEYNENDMVILWESWGPQGTKLTYDDNSNMVRLWEV